MNIDFLNKKKLCVFGFDCQITDKRSGETENTKVCWLEPNNSESSESHAKMRIIQICDDLGYEILIQPKSEVRDVELDKTLMFKEGDSEL